jgi:acetyl-CoA carboxylase biotin carboxyl carrier protein
MEQWGIAELHLKVEDGSVDLVRAVHTAPAEMIAAMAHSEAPVPCAVEEGPQTVVLNAPVVGVFHLARRGFPQGSAEPGDQVQAGQVIGAIELMHVPTDLISPVSGIIEGVLVEEAVGVEYGQPLLVIRPFEEVSEDEAGMLPSPAR